MANTVKYLHVPIEGESPYVVVTTPWVNGDDHIIIYPFNEKEDLPLPHFSLVAGAWRLENDATVANRRMLALGWKVFGPESGDKLQVWGYKSNGDITASQKGQVVFIKDNAYTNLYNLTYDVNYSQAARLTQDSHILIGDDYMDMYVDAGVAGDQHRIALVFEYLNYRMGITKRC